MDKVGCVGDATPRVHIRIERLHNMHQHSFQVDGPRREVACPQQEDRAAACIDAGAIEQLHCLDVAQVRKTGALVAKVFGVSFSVRSFGWVDGWMRGWIGGWVDG